MILLFMLSFILTATIQAQVALDPQQFVNVQILADTLADGSRTNTVYTVERNTVYAFDGRLDLDFELEIIGPDNGPIIHDSGTPAALVNTPDASTGDARQFFEIKEGGSLVLKNLIITGLVSTGEISSDLVVKNGGSYFEAQNVVFSDFWSRAVRNRAVGGQVILRDNVWINGVRTSFSTSGGMVCRFDVGSDYALIENNTMVNVGRLIANRGPFLNMQMHILHNSYVNVYKNAMETRAYEFICANNMFYNWQFTGYNEEELGEFTNDGKTYTIHFTTDNEFAPVADKLDSVSCYLGDNAFYLEDEITEYFNTTDGQYITRFWEFSAIDSFVTIDGADYKFGANYNEFNPEFVATTWNPDLMVQYVNGRSLDPQPEWVDWRTQSPVTFDSGTPIVTWPLGFDFNYTNTTLKTAGSDGLPIGDLNWFPDEKATYLANRDQYVSALQDSVNNAKAIYVPGTPTPMITPGTVDVEDLDIIPTEYALDQNYPNPFNPTTNIRFSLPESIFNVLGQEVAKIVDQELKAGSYNYSFDASNLVSGIYVYQLTTENFVTSKKMMLLK